MASMTMETHGMWAEVSSSGRGRRNFNPRLPTSTVTFTRWPLPHSYLTSTFLICPSGCRILFLSHHINTETNFRNLKYVYDTRALQSRVKYVIIDSHTCFWGPLLRMAIRAFSLLLCIACSCMCIYCVFNTVDCPSEKVMILMNIEIDIHRSRSTLCRIDIPAQHSSRSSAPIDLWHFDAVSAPSWRLF